MTIRSTVLALFLIGCTTDPVEVQDTPRPVLPLEAQALRDAMHPTGSSTLTAMATHVYNVNTEAGTLTRTSTATGETLEIDVGVEPTRIARSGDTLFVTLRGERSLVTLSASNLERGVTGRVRLGAEPHGVVAREDGQRVYVALSQQDQVVELDAHSLEVLHTYEVQGEPRYLALHPSGGALFVGSGRGEARLSRISLVTHAVTPVPMPQTRRFTEEAEIALIPRLTGDVWITPDGTRLLVPVLYADNTTPIADVAVGGGGEVEAPPQGEEGYGGRGDGVDKFTPSVVEVPLGTEGELTDDDARALFVSTTIFTQVEDLNIGSYISGVVSSPDSRRYLVTMEGSDAAVLVDPNSWVMGGFFFDLDGDGAPAQDEDGDGFGDEPFFNGIFTSPEEGGFAPIALTVMHAGPGARGAVFASDDVVFSHNAFNGSITELDHANGRLMLQEAAEFQFNSGAFTTPLSTWTVSQPVLSEQLREGRRLFYSATESAMGTGGISCATCHFEGRNDGLTWSFESGIRQTPSLAGVVSETAPVTWTGDVPSVAAEANITSRGRMGGQGLSSTQLEAVAAYVDWTRLPDTERLIELSVTRGRQIFERADVGCASCHSGDRFTDNESHTVAGVANLNTPGLRGIAGTAPYLHDGGAATLMDVLEWSRSGEMGDTSMLIEAQMVDLEAYLRSL